jgi:N-acetyl-anhydromuramyl-L-alanine amidase AmpD
MKSNFVINHQYSSSAFNERGFNKKIQSLILHCTKQDFATSLCLLQDKVSSHYLISESAEIFQLVDESKRAWHAGDSFWRGEVDLNSTSIGIEIVNLDGNYHPYSNQQIEALIYLCQKIITEHKIAPEFVLAHSDIAPYRKDDPGILFPWERIYKNGIGLMADLDDVMKIEKTINLPTALELQKSLANYGYKIDLTKKFDEQTMIVFNAFRRHFCPKFFGCNPEKTSYAILLFLIKCCI